MKISDFAQKSSILCWGVSKFGFAHDLGMLIGFGGAFAKSISPDLGGACEQIPRQSVRGRCLWRICGSFGLRAGPGRAFGEARGATEALTVGLRLAAAAATAYNQAHFCRLRRSIGRAAFPSIWVVQEAGGGASLSMARTVVHFQTDPWGIRLRNCRLSQ